MRAVWWTEAGPPDVLVPGEAPDRRPGGGQVLVRVMAAGITFVETQLRSGRSARPSLRPPAILGNAVGGSVVAVGEGVDSGLIGRQVVTSTGGSGGYAELAIASAADVQVVPGRLGLPEAVALLADGRTAVGLLRVAAPQAGETLLVEAAGGGLGSLLVQLAAATGARVIAAAAGASKLELARTLGAQVAVDYTAADWTAQVAEAAPGGLDVAFDGVGGAIGRAALEAMAPGGRFIVHGLASGATTDTAGAEARGVAVTGLRQLEVLARSSRELTAEALREAATGRLRPVIGQTFPLERAADAHAAIEARRTLGKTLLTVV